MINNFCLTYILLPTHTCITVVYLQKSARQLQLLTNDLFRLEDKIDELNKQGALSNIILLKREPLGTDTPQNETDVTQSEG